MYAVIETGGKQYRVAEGDKLRVEKLDAEAGTSVDLDRVLMIADGGTVEVGKPLIEGGKVTAQVAGHGRGDKVKIIKFRRRKHHMKRQGHRQWFTELKITGISGAGISGTGAAATPDAASIEPGAASTEPGTEPGAAGIEPATRETTAEPGGTQE